MKKESDLRGKVRGFLEKLPKLETTDIRSLSGMEAFSKGEECFRKMKTDLWDQVTYWSQLRTESNSVLWNSVQAILNNLEQIIPTEGDIQTICRVNNLYGENAWETMLHYVRNIITEKFIAIDDVLEEETRNFKNSLVRQVYYELRVLSGDQEDHPAEADEDNKVDMVRWIKTMMDHYLKDNPEYEQIYKAFEFLYKFEFNTRAQLIQEVRKQLFIINPICSSEYVKTEYNFKNETIGKEIRYFLTSRISLIEDLKRFLERAGSQ